MKKTTRELNIPIAQIKMFIVTGLIYCTNKRFPTIKTSSYIQAMGINLWRGSVWAQLDNGKRKLLKRVYN